ncbi:MBL fold metallo-hydrolase [Pantoea sp. BL1]|uniref:MBL fold metallo-hydrolase n=1 Tax=Pantoea sp. BL1 TaxID=1628190 RepID=UPI0009E3619E|nr:MBL fold metallo-hydrolase [Pantoea sp. BL1]
MASLTVISGVGGKLPAAFLVEMEGYRLLWDLGAGPQPGVRPDIRAIGRVDALCLTHSHIDHAASLDCWAQIGSPPVYATEQTWLQLANVAVPMYARRLLPLRGQTAIGPLHLFTGRSGHSPGSVWFHLPMAGGITYMGDWSREALLLPFDCPPSAKLLITDASYGDRTQRLRDQMDALAMAATHGAVIAVPEHGRGPEVALQLTARGLAVQLCPQIRSEVAQLLAMDKLPATTALELVRLLKQPQPQQWQPADVIVAADAVADSGLAAQLSAQPGFKLIFSSHVAPGTRAARLLADQQAQWLPWNVHPPIDDQLWLIEKTAAQRVIPAFVAAAECPILAARAPLCWQAHFPLQCHLDSPRFPHEQRQRSRIN